MRRATETFIKFVIFLIAAVVCFSIVQAIEYFLGFWGVLAAAAIVCTAMVIQLHGDSHD